MKNLKSKCLLIGAVAGMAAVCVFGFILFDALILEPNWISVTRVKIKDPVLAEALAGAIVVQISDLGVKDELGYREETLIRKINRLHPDLILITGDLVEGDGAEGLITRFISQLKPSLWCYGILGNSDTVYLRGQRYKEVWRRAGLSLIGGRVLAMSVGKSEKRFWLAGIDFPGYGGGDVGGKLDEVFRDIPPGAPVIFLSYSPEVAPQLIRKGARLVLSGDTHGGQINLPGLSALFQALGRSRFVRGLYRLEGGHLYVNRGVSTKHLPLRFLCPPEITVFQFTS